jgi:hypothetical protein
VANSVATQLIIDGPRNAVLKVAGILDTSDLASTVIADPAALVGIDNTGGLKAATFRIIGLNYSIEDGLEVRLFWDATTPVLIEALNGRGALPPSCQRYGGLTNNAGIGKTGRITMTTEGWAGIKSFSYILELVKVQSGVVLGVAGTVGIYNPGTVSEGYADIAGTIPLSVS